MIEISQTQRVDWIQWISVAEKRVFNGTVNLQMEMNRNNLWSSVLCLFSYLLTSIVFA